MYINTYMRHKHEPYNTKSQALRTQSLFHRNNQDAQRKTPVQQKNKQKFKLIFYIHVTVLLV